MKFVSLFAGIGGFDLGLERAGHTCVGQCEIDPHARDVLTRHWPNVPKHDDITTLKHDTFPHPHIVTFGSPCQDLSIAGKRAGMSDGTTRSGLFYEAVRYIREIQEATDGLLPSVALWENVPGAYSSNDGRDFATVLELLVGGSVRTPTRGWPNAGVAFGPLGSAEWRTLDSQHFGVAQRRRRVFLVYRPGSDRAGEVLLEPDGVQRDIASRGASGEDLAPSLSARASYDRGDGSEPIVPVLMPTMRAGSVGTASKNQISGDTRDEYIVPVAFKVRGGKEGGGKGYLGSDDQALTLDTMQGQYLAQPLAYAARDYSTGRYEQADIAEAITTSADRTRAEPGLPNGTLLANSNAHVATSYAVRRLTPRECERLQAFPDDHTRYRPDGTEIADTHRYRMCGNAVTVNVIEWIARRLPQ